MRKFDSGLWGFWILLVSLLTIVSCGGENDGDDEDGSAVDDDDDDDDDNGEVDDDTADDDTADDDDDDDGLGRQWTVDEAWAWYDAQPWLVGANFIPSTAINQLEMWQAETFDPTTIDRELGWAEDLGFNVVRVFLHDLLWKQDPEGFLARVDTYLTIADSHGIRTLLVLFDNVWDPFPHLGTQPEPVPGVHNSGWVESPSWLTTVTFPIAEGEQARLERYVKGVVGALRDDPRVLGWDVLNEPGNSGIGALSVPLLQAAFRWARAMKPTQPLTAGSWEDHGQSRESRVGIALSDFVSFHDYGTLDGTAGVLELIESLTERPIVCTEYMARTLESRFETHLPLFADRRVGAFNWGLVYGKTQTIFPWRSPEQPSYPPVEPDVWFHDIMRADATPYDAAETAFLREYIAEVNGAR